MRFGRFTKRVRVQVRVTGEGAYGGSSGSTWTDEAERWMQLEPLRATELAAFNATETRVSHRARCRHYEGLSTARHRLVYGSAPNGRVYNLVEVRDLRERHHNMELLCIEVEGETA